MEWLTSYKIIAIGAKMITTIPLNLLSNAFMRQASVNTISWEEEREDILGRANWLCREVIKMPEQLIASAPSMIGKVYQGEWAIYSCSMLAHALANISSIYPDKASQCSNLIAKLIEMVRTPAMRQYDTLQWKEDAMETLDGPRSHMTYLSILAWMCTNYKICGGDTRYDDLLSRLCSVLVRRMYESRFDLNLLSFPRKPIWISDMLVTLVALRNYGRLCGGEYEETIEEWLHNAKTKWIHKRTGLLAGMLPGASRSQNGIMVRGSHSALNCSYLTMVDEAFAFEQYERMKHVFGHSISLLGCNIVGLKEYQNNLPSFSVKAGDAGLIIKGLSAGAMCFGLGAPTFFGDWEFRHQLLRSAEIASGTVKTKGMRHYRLAKLFIVGEATALAMRTNVKRK